MTRARECGEIVHEEPGACRCVLAERHEPPHACQHDLGGPVSQSEAPTGGEQR